MTNEAKHTTGPWTIERYGDGSSLVIHHDTMSRVCFMATPGSNGDPETIEADAKLIAAAPDMLAALKMVSGMDIHHEVLRSVDAAIAKATS